MQRVGRSKHDAVTSVELTWAIPSAAPPLPKGGAFTRTLPGLGSPSRGSVPGLGSGIRPPRFLPAPEVDLSTLICVLDREATLQNATRLVETEARRLSGSALALCVFFDWARRVAWTLQGHDLGDAVNELVAEVAGSGKAAWSPHVIIEPVGRVPTRTVLLTRRDEGTYVRADYAAIATLARSVAMSFDRLIRASTGRP